MSEYNTQNHTGLATEAAAKPAPAAPTTQLQPEDATKPKDYSDVPFSSPDFPACVTNNASFTETLGPVMASLPKATETLFPEGVSRFDTDVLIVGAGITGLTAGVLLKRAGVPFKIVEANAIVGGRIRAVDGMLRFPVEIGAECMHGHQTILGDWMRTLDLPCHRFDHPYAGNYYYVYCGKDQAPPRDYVCYNARTGYALVPQGDKAHPDVSKFEELHATLLTHPLPDDPEADVSMGDLYKQHGATASTLELIDAAYGNDYGCRIAGMSAAEVALEARRWEITGDSNYRIGGSFRQLMLHMVEAIGPENILLEWPVERIVRPDPAALTPESRCEVYGPCEQSITAKKVIMTASLNVLKAGIIGFEPALPEWKAKAHARSAMSPMGGKLIVRFRGKFWPGNIGVMIFPDHLFPELGFNADEPVGFTLGLSNADRVDVEGRLLYEDDEQTRYRHADDPAFRGHDMGSLNSVEASEHSIVIGFMTGEFMQKVEETSGTPEAAVRAMLDQLDDVFGTPEAPKPASDAYADYLYMNFGRDRYIRGAYSYPNKGSVRAKYELARPVDGTLHFAGEHTNVQASYASIHAAMESAYRVVEEVSRDLCELEHKPVCPKTLHLEDLNKAMEEMACQ